MNTHDMPGNNENTPIEKPEASLVPEQIGEALVTPEIVAEHSQMVEARVNGVLETTAAELASGEASFDLDQDTVEATRAETGIQGKLDANGKSLAELQQKGRRGLESLLDFIRSDTVSEVVDFIPVVGPAMGMTEAVAGKRLTGEKLAGDERWQHAAANAASFGADMVGIGEISKAVKVGKVAMKAGEARMVEQAGKKIIQEGSEMVARGRKRSKKREPLREAKEGDKQDSDAEKKEGALVKRAKVFLKEWHREKLGFIAEQYPNIPQKDLEAYLSAVSPEVRILVKEWRKSGLFIEMTNYLGGALSGDSLSFDYESIGMDERQALSEELDAEYGVDGIGGSPLADDFLTEEIVDIRAQHLLARKEGGETADSVRMKFLLFLYDQYQMHNLAAPKELKLLIPAEKRRELDSSYVQYAEHFDDRAEAIDDEIENRKDAHQEQKAVQMRSSGVHEAIIKNNLSVERERGDKGFDEILDRIGNEDWLEIQQLDALIKRNPDPRVIVDQILGLKDGEIPFPSEKK